MLSIIFQFANNFLKKTKILRIKRVRNFFWDLRAFDINEKWGSSTSGYYTLEKIIAKTKATKILDFGCGSGRLFPLFEALKIEEVVGQDISPNAIRLVKKTHPNTNYTLLCCEIENFSYKKKYFDLIISNRSLSAIPPDEISPVMDKLCSLGKYFFLNELSEMEGTAESSYWFKHDYQISLTRNNFRLIDKGLMSGSTEEWSLFESSSDMP